MTRDPWTLGAAALLALLTLAVVQVYRTAPQSVAEARDRAVLAARPDAFGPRLARAEALLAQAQSVPAGADSVAAAGYRAAAEEAARAAEAASDAEQAASARGVWGRATLGWSERLLAAGTGQGIRPDDDPLLRAALRLADRVVAARPDPALLARAESLRERIRRQLRTGPLEWLPAR